MALSEELHVVLVFVTKKILEFYCYEFHATSPSVLQDPSFVVFVNCNALSCKLLKAVGDHLTGTKIFRTLVVLSDKRIDFSATLDVTCPQLQIDSYATF